MFFISFYTMNKSIQAIVFDNFTGNPLKTTFLNDRWWVTTAGEELQPLEAYFRNENIRFVYLAEADGKVGALALAKMLGWALEEPEDAIDKVLRRRVESLKRLGVTLDVKDEPLQLEVEVFNNDDKPARQGSYSAWCYATGTCFELLFDIDGFSNQKTAEEWMAFYLDFLKNTGIDYTLIRKHNGKQERKENQGSRHGVLQPNGQLVRLHAV